MDETKRFISRQNVSLIQRMIGSSFQDARNHVIRWLQKHDGFVSSLSDANESLINEIKGVSQRPVSNIKMGKQDETESIQERLTRMQQQRTMMTERRPIQTQPNENTLIQNESREDIMKQTSQRLEEMQRLRSVTLPVAPPSDMGSSSDDGDAVFVQPQTSISTSGKNDITVVFHSQHSERKQGQEWWDRIWNVPEIHTMAMAHTLQIPYVYVETKRRSTLRRLLVKISGVQESSHSWILTPSQTKQDGVLEYKVIDEIEDETRNVWSYHLEPTQSSGWNWGSKTDRIQVGLVPMQMGHFWQEDEVVSWSIIVRWHR